MLSYINSRLVQWAEWVKRKDDGGLGFPRECSYTRLQGRGSNGFRPNVDNEAWEIEQAVTALQVESPHLHQVVQLFYLRSMTAQQMADKCGCSRDTLYTRLHHAHVEIMNWMQCSVENT